ncbi:YidH family protein [Pseudalkalibacillus decolorationis]|uniref:YidH family protein n=1 Tax=Pseudalkalibacillus decolorationis TaxID=163879 RepID=UPI0021487C7A|nr:DUF202 domain-containing protein [Pseudalkalibacillus decolorationis]
MEKTRVQHYNQLQYAQQHLANERTYLAWIRTAIAIIGIGLLTLHFFFGNLNYPFANILVLVIGISTAVFGVAITLIATLSYLQKKKQIESQIFYSSHIPMYFVSLMLTLTGVFALFISLLTL